MHRRVPESPPVVTVSRPTSLKRNVVANYTSQGYVTVLGIVVVPLYLKYMGAEAYGLVGFFAMLQMLFNLLDMGLTPTMARETARFYGGATDGATYRQFVRALEGVFALVAVIGGSAMFASSGVIARDWLRAALLPPGELQVAIRLMAVMVALRWVGELYRGAITGAEQFVWLGRYAAIVATFRYLGVLPVLKYVGSTPRIFFSYQACVALVELSGLAIMAYRLMPRNHDRTVGWSWEPLRPVLKFSLTIAFTSSVWVLVTQSDKLVLSKFLPLASYGYYTLAVLVASAVSLVGGPVSGAIMPRMAKLEAAGDNAGVIVVYRAATQLVCVIALPVAFTLAAFAEQIVWAWTGDHVAATSVAPILRLYALGNGLLVVSAFPYYLQYAKGNLRLHVIGSAGFLVVLLPSVIWGSLTYGAVGAAWAWLIANAIYFLAWVPLVHHRLEPGLHSKWLLADVGVIACAALAAVELMMSLAVLPTSRLQALFVAAAAGAGVLAVAMIASSQARAQLVVKLEAWRR